MHDGRGCEVAETHYPDIKMENYDRPYPIFHNLSHRQTGHKKVRCCSAPYGVEMLLETRHASSTVVAKLEFKGSHNSMS